MKKLFTTMLTFLACGAAYALPVGNPSDASLLCDGLFWEGYCCSDLCDPCLSWCDAFSVRAGFYGDYVFNRHLELEHRGHPDIENTEIYTNAGFVAGNFYDRVDVFATFGASSILVDTNEKTFGVAGSGRIEIETETDFSWSVGVRGTIWECGCTSLGAEAQYFRTRPHIMRVTDKATNSEYPANNVNAKYSEWQVGVGLSHRIYMFVPYIAVKWSGCDLDFDNALFTQAGPSQLFNAENKKLWGYAVGLTFVDCEKASITAEGRFGDEKALYVNGQIRF